MSQWKKNAHDFLALAGILCITAGLSMIYPPAAWIVDGTILLATGFILGRGKQ